MRLSVIIPTKNRKSDLIALINSLMGQSIIPDELIIIDQSDTLSCKSIIINKWNTIENSKLKYIHDTSISSLVKAKWVGSKLASSEIICFLDDDLILDKHFLREIIKPFFENFDIKGSSGIFINYPKTSFAYKVIYSFFHKGIFKDPRPAVFKKYFGYCNNLLKTTVLWGGITAWRSEILQEVEFDTENSLFMMEDFDYSRKIRENFNGGLYLNPNARVVHNHSQTNRASEYEQEKRKIFEYLAFYKKWKHTSYSLIPLIWLFIGLFLHVLYRALSNKNIKLISAFWSGIKMSVSR